MSALALHFTQHVVNVQWGEKYYALVWVSAIASEDEAPAFSASISGLVEGAKVVFQRTFQETIPSSAGISYGVAAIAGATYTAWRIVAGGEFESYTEICGPILGPDGLPVRTSFHYTPIPGGTAHLVWPGAVDGLVDYGSDEDAAADAAAGLAAMNAANEAHLPVSCASSGPHDEYDYANNLAIITSTPAGTIEWEAVFLIKLPAISEAKTASAFTVRTGAHNCVITIMLYPQKGISVDPTNTVPGPFGSGNPSNGRVYVPLKFTDGKIPMDPTDKTWPGYDTVGGPKQDVRNATNWSTGISLHDPGGAQSLQFVITSDDHLKEPPVVPDPMVRNKIIQMYLKKPTPAGFEENSFIWVNHYCDKSYGKPFDGSEFGEASGPLPKIETDIPLS